MLFGYILSKLTRWQNFRPHFVYGNVVRANPPGKHSPLRLPASKGVHQHETGDQAKLEHIHRPNSKANPRSGRAKLN